MGALKSYRLGVVSPAEGSREDLIAALIRQAQRYHYASLQDLNLIVAARHNAYASGIIGTLSEQTTEDEVQGITGFSLKALRDDIYDLQDKLEGKAFELVPDIEKKIETESPWLGEEKSMFHRKGPWLGQIPLVLGPSSWGAGMIPTGPARPMRPLLPEDYENDLAGRLGAPVQAMPPYFGQWGLADGSASGQEGPFDTIDEAFNAAVKAVREAGAKALPNDGFAQVVDSKGLAVGPVT